MPDRAYTVAEIDRMRHAVEHRFLFGCSISNSRKSGTPMQSRVYRGGEKNTAVEEQLRTYMLAGVKPEDLE